MIALRAESPALRGLATVLPPARVPALGAALLVALGGCGGAQGGALPGDVRALGPGSFELALEHGGAERTALVFVPEAVREGRPLPLVLAFHGGGGNARQFRDSNGFEAIAEREGFVVVHPDGTGRIDMRSWNAGGCCGLAHTEEIDDVGYLLALLDELEGRLPIDAERVFATGHSNGAMMSFRLAADAGDRIRAIAPLGAALLTEAGPGSRPVRVLYIHSVDDPRALYEGGLGPPYPLTGVQIDHVPAIEVLDHWRGVNGCSARSEETDERFEERPFGQEPHRAVRIEWNDCSSGAPVHHWRLEGPGHGWPGARQTLFGLAFMGPATSVIDASEEAWAFFRAVAP